MPFTRNHVFLLVGFAAAWLYPASAAAATTDGNELPQSVETLLIAVAAAVAIAVLVAGVELSLRIARERRAGEPESPYLSSLYAQRLHTRVLYGFAPPAVASTIALVRTDELSTAAFLFAAMTLTTAILTSHRHPLHLMPIARFAFNAFVPAAGVAVALLPAAFGQSLIETRTAFAALLAAIVTTLIAALLESRFEADRPIRVAVIGPADFAEKLAAELIDTRIRSYRVIGYIGPHGPDHAVPHLGTPDDVRAAVTEHGLDLLVLAPQNPRLKVFEQVARACLDLPVRMIEATALYEDVLGHVPIGTINSAWFQFIMHPRYTPSSPLSKRVLDLVVSASILVVTLPLFALCAIAVWLEDRGPVFYRQRRVGEEGRVFAMVKFRTLRPDADALFGIEPEEMLVTRVGRAPAQDPPQRAAAAVPGAHGRDEPGGPPARAAGAGRGAIGAGAVLRAARAGQARPDRLGPGALRLLGHAGRHRLEDVPRPLLHQAPVGPVRPADPAADPARPRGA